MELQDISFDEYFPSKMANYTTWYFMFIRILVTRRIAFLHCFHFQQKTMCLFHILFNALILQIYI